MAAATTVGTDGAPRSATRPSTVLRCAGPYPSWSHTCRYLREYGAPPAPPEVGAGSRQWLEAVVELHADDAGFVRVSAEVVDTTIVDVEGWGRWWPGIRLVARPTPTSDLLWLVELRRGVARRFRYELVRRQYRPAKGIEFALRGDLVGRAEFWYEPVTGGTVVHHLLAARTTLSRPGAVLRDYRRAVRRALAGLKDEVEMAQRVAAGLPP